MKARDYLIFWLAAAILLVIMGLFQSAPGYMDAEYYYSMGLRIVNNGSLAEPFLWNYLHDLRFLPHPGFTYWQPLPAFIAAAGILLSGINTFLGAKLGFILISSFIPIITVILGWEFTRDRRVAILAGLLSLFPVLYAPFLGTTDAFGLMIVLGGVYLLSQNRRSKPGYLLLWGISAGLIHLTRSDGLIWLSVGLLICLLDRDKILSRIGLFLLGYLIVMGPWLVRNLVVLGEFLPSGINRMFWLSEYNDLFSYRPENLTFETWRSLGLANIFDNIKHAFGANIRTAIFVQGQLILAPLAIIGYWTKKNVQTITSGILIYGLIFILMTFVFPFAGWRGGFFHAGAGLQSLYWVLSGAGFSRLIQVGIKKRDWKENRAIVMFGAALVMIMAFATGYVYWIRVFNGDGSNPGWEQSERDALIVDAELDRLGIPDDVLIMINNPPGLFAASGRSSIVIPHGPVEDLMDASEEFGVQYLVLERNHSVLLDELYKDPDGNPLLDHIHSHNGAHYFIFAGDY